MWELSESVIMKTVAIFSFLLVFVFWAVAIPLAIIWIMIWVALNWKTEKALILEQLGNTVGIMGGLFFGLELLAGEEGVTVLYYILLGVTTSISLACHLAFGRPVLPVYELTNAERLKYDAILEAKRAANEPLLAEWDTRNH